MPIPRPRRTFSDTSHVSDSEPEGEARHHNKAQSSSPPPPQRTPLSSISNTLVGSEPIGRRTLETRLSKVEGEMADIKHEIRILRRGKRNRTSKSPPSTPLPKRRHTMRADTAITETPISRSSLRTSTPERDEIARYVSEGIRQSLRECHRQCFERAPAAPGPSGVRRKLCRRAHEYM
ncbi:hypothetical protein B0H11DRAFT_2020987 [Mycena galericulata]|nr:hypothetical protein B0H11DRAFT_2020987 [Mycena galericulata]